MTDFQAALITDAEKFATDLFENKISDTVRYHNLQHTQSVVKASQEMADYYSLNEEDRVALLIAAWFHDTGFVNGEADGHEVVSEQLALTFLQGHQAPETLIHQVTDCIRATKMPQNPVTLIEQIICDADLYHLGTEDFSLNSQHLRQELNDFSGKDISKKKWRKMNIALMEGHTYFTDYARRHLQPIKAENLAALKDKNLPEKKNPTKKKDQLLETFTEELKNDQEIKKRKDKDNQTERGISTVFRIMASNQANLSHMADNKAHIMISVNSIILSVVIALISKRLDEHPLLAIPTIALIVVCVATMIFSILATRPNITKGTFTPEDIQQKKTNLLFFGNFHNMNLPDYDWAMKEMLEDKNYLYSSMIKDSYFLGVVLAKKYRLLRISYNIFMFGMVVSMFIFGIVLGYEAIFVHTAGK